MFLSTPGLDGPLLAAASAEALDRSLGHPLEDGRPFSFRQLIALDESEHYPESQLGALRDLGLHRYHIPAQDGGALTSVQELILLVQLLARRDLSVAVAHSTTLLGSMTTWQAGTDAQRRAMQQRISRGQNVAFGLTERAHGSDVTANQVQADKVDGGWVLNGQKWLIANANRSAAVTVYARTDPRGGVRGFSLFLVDKEHADQSSIRHLPKIPTLGLRACDVSGIEFDNCFVPDTALVGQQGAGLELATKGLYVTRTVCGGLALGAADTALRVVTDFALTRQLYGGALVDIPHAQASLAESFADLLVAESTTLTAARAMHVMPRQMSIWSAVVKYLVPETVEAMVSRLSAVLGARYFLRDEHWRGIFQKVYRDCGIISVFEGSSAVQLNDIALQLGQLLRPPEHGSGAPQDDSLFDLTAALPAARLSDFDLSAHARDAAVSRLSQAAERLAGLQGDPTVAPGVVDALLESAHFLEGQLSRLRSAVAAHASMADRSPEALGLARRFCLIHAGAAALLSWLDSRHGLHPALAAGEWLALGLDRLGAQLQPDSNQRTSPWTRPVLETLLEFHRTDRLFSLTALNLAPGPDRDRTA